MTNNQEKLTIKDLTAAQFFVLKSNGQKYMFRRVEGEVAICSPTENPSQMIELGLNENIELSKFTF